MLCESSEIDKPSSSIQSFEATPTSETPKVDVEIEIPKLYKCHPCGFIFLHPDPYREHIREVHRRKKAREYREEEVQDVEYRGKLRDRKPAPAPQK
jgi:uncharacterized C2H2 Zn-finger protein